MFWLDIAISMYCICTSCTLSILCTCLWLTMLMYQCIHMFQFALPLCCMFYLDIQYFQVRHKSQRYIPFWKMANATVSMFLLDVPNMLCMFLLDFPNMLCMFLLAMYSQCYVCFCGHSQFYVCLCWTFSILCTVCFWLS